LDSPVFGLGKLDLALGLEFTNRKTIAVWYFEQDIDWHDRFGGKLGLGLPPFRTLVDKAWRVTETKPDI
jgi:hypothetical protein